MGSIVAKRAITILLFLSLVSSCGELELGALLPTNGTYQVRTLVNGISLEDCSIIRSNDKIRPYFAASVADDPDLIGILVYLQNSQGEIIGDKARYILEQYAGELPVETELWEETASIEAEENEIETESENEDAEKADEPKTVTEASSKSIEETPDEGKAPEWPAWELPENGAPGEKWSSAEKETLNEKTGTEAVIVVKSLNQELPYFPLPKNLEIGPYTLVFEALGKKETLSRTETNVIYLGSAKFNLKDISIYLPGLSGSQLISPETTVMLEAGLDFDKKFEPYIIWYNGKRVIGEGKISEGAGNILWKTPDQPGFYSLRAEVFPFLVKRNLAGFIREITVPVSTKAASLSYFFDNDSALTSRSLLAEGTAYPEQVRLIKAMIASIKEEEDADEKEIPVMPSPPKLLRWYQFEGNLRDTQSSLPNEASLAPSAGTAPHWDAAGQSYGLSIEADDAYQLSPINFFRNEKDQGGGIFLLHLRFPTDGAVLSAFFPSQSSSAGGVWMNMIKERNKIMLRLSNGNAAVELPPVYLSSYESRGLVPIVVEFYIRQYRLEAKMSLNGEYSQDSAGSINLPYALAGEGRITLGAFSAQNAQYQNNAAQRGIKEIPNTKNGFAPPVDKPVQQITATALRPLTDETLSDNSDEFFSLPGKNAGIPSTAEISISGTEQRKGAIWDELAILYSSVPLLEEEIHEEDITEEEEAVIDTLTSLSLSSSQEKIPAPDFPAESNSTKTNNEKAEKAGENEELFPAADMTDFFRTWKNLAALPENS
ncbi:MAG: hypothetical protein LBG95_08115 [Treponema sp.]|jgi:hypothetical protein|nr:hypothetical protein [Treponema sp.]